MHRYNFPTEIHFGAGARKILPAKLKEAGVKRALLVTDKGVAGPTPLLSHTVERVAVRRSPVVRAVAAEACAGDVVLVMSNGSFVIERSHSNTSQVMP